ncbi:translation initiation factor eIF 4e-like domain-containing protein [Geranomyces variabilis]|nr:translation initiation factor eIF 4e-like domain-containing protein [Geranomyces variabilis]KAJ3138259.1 hypothetical protein HDU90_001221 [Geranomyces variabilis]
MAATLNKPTSASPLPHDDEPAAASTTTSTTNHSPSAASSDAPAAAAAGGSTSASGNAEDDLMTVFEDPVNFNVKHPLQNRWTLWFDNPQKRTGQHNWEKSLKNLITFDTVEDFWGVYNNVVVASQLAHGANYHLFKEGVRPMWEDPENENGGKWIFPVPKAKRGDLDQSWLFTMLACIGESFNNSEEICGAVVSIRKQQDRIALWTKHALDSDAATAAGGHWKSILQLPDADKIGYQAHSDALRKNSSFSNQDMYTV